MNKKLGFKIEKLQKEHNTMIVLLERTIKSLEKKDYKIKKLLKRFKVIAIDHFLTEDLLLYPRLIRSAIHKKNSAVTLYQEEKDFSVTSGISEKQQEVNVSELFSEDSVKQELMAFSVFSMRIINTITEIENNMTQEFIEKNKKKLSLLVKTLEERFAYEEAILYSRARE